MSPCQSILTKLFATICVMAASCIAGAASTQDGNNYSGSDECVECHATEYSEWLESDHFHAMETATPESVLADFSGQPALFHDVTYRFYVDAENYYVDIQHQGEEPETFRIDYTFGHQPLQQYLIELEDGHIQALNVAWDSRPVEEGGQRWFHLQPDEDITPEHPFYWKNYFQNWNSRCADCHSTNLSRNYEVDSHSYQTTWSEMTVGCEACHGPASGHIERVESDSYDESNTGFADTTPAFVKWTFQDENPIAVPEGGQTDHHIDMCGTCHSLRTPLSEVMPATGYHDSNRIQLISDQSYYRDGQVREEAYVLGSFMQSKMYEQGVTCTNCHNPHSGKVLAEGNSLCAQCHQPAVFDNPDHHHHPVASEGAQCVNCHMPETTYMQVDDRRDHSFTIPRPNLTEDLGVPNACSSCHAGRSNSWVSETLVEWGVESDESHWAYLSASAQDSDGLAVRPLTDLLNRDSLPVMVQASLLEQLGPMPSRVSAETAQRQLGSENPLIRRAAVSAMQAMPMEVRWELLSPHFTDPSRSVRYEIAATLVDGYAELYPEQKELLDPLVEEYRNMLSVTADSPATQLAIANLELARRNLVAAEKAYLQALRIEPAYVPGLLNLADYYRSIGREYQAAPLMEKALEVAPDSGGANHAWGLYLIRQGLYGEALPWLEAATRAEDAQPRFSYVYAIALETAGDIQSAIDTLIEADARWPNQYEILQTLVLYLDQTGDTGAVLPYLSELSRIAPGAPAVKQLVEKYQNL